MMFKITVIAMIIVLVIGVIVRIAESTEEPSEEGEHRDIIERKDSFPITRTIKKGDYVSRICVDIYGFTNDKLIEWIHYNNPQIDNIDHILVGERVFFPRLYKNKNEI